MDAKQTRAVFGAILLTGVLCLASPLLGIRQITSEIPVEIRPQFDAGRALQTTQEFVTRYPRRIMGSIEARQSTGFLQTRLQDLGYQTSYAHFDAIVAGRRQVGRNIYAFKRGQTAEILAVLAHYDTAGTTIQGAMDDGSGVGILLELARLMAVLPTHRSLLFVTSDGEEWGMLGARELVANYSERKRIVTALSLDYVAVGDLAEITLDTAGQMGGYSPPWLRVLARGAAETEGMRVEEPAGFRELLERALPFSWTDQGPFLNAGIPAINMGSISRDHSKELGVYHTARDTADNLKLESFEKYGRAVERVLLGLDSMRSVPQESMEPLRVGKNLFLPPFLVVLLSYLAFGPFLVMVCIHLVNHRRYLGLERLQREIISFLGTLLPLLLPFPIIRTASFLRRLPRYSLYPATPKDPVLEHPAWGVMAAMTITVLAAAVGCYFLMRFLSRRLPQPDFYASKTILLLIFLAVILLSLIYNPSWAVGFLLLPACLWGLVGPGSGAGGRAANRILILSAGALYLMVSCSYAAHLCLGWQLIWYEILAVSTGMFSWKGYLLSAAASALCIRFLVIQSQNRGN